jgi:hypothetical protein
LPPPIPEREEAKPVSSASAPSKSEIAPPRLLRRQEEIPAASVEIRNANALSTEAQELSPPAGAAGPHDDTPRRRTLLDRLLRRE